VGTSAKPSVTQRRLYNTQHSHIVNNVLNHPFPNPNLIILDIKEDNQVIARLVNTYHTIPPIGHGLQYLFNYSLGELIPTAIIGNLNIYSTLWSLEGKNPSPWARVFEDWLKWNNFLLLKP
jgi:hypothetical protein